MNSVELNLSRDTLNQLASEVWVSMANLELTPSAEIYVPNSSGYVVSSVQIVGAWEGAVRIDIDLPLAVHTTASLLAVDESEVSIDDLHDAVGELANMTGGGVKALLQSGCSLSLPSVASGSSYRFQICHGRTMTQSVFLSKTGRLQVTVLEKERGSRP